MCDRFVILYIRCRSQQTHSVKTCRELLFIGSQRSVWLEAASQIMEEHYILPATYPISSLNQSALEYISLSSYRLRQLLSHSKGSSLYPYSTLLLPLHLSKEKLTKLSITSVSDCHYIILIPGGRFLVTIRDAITPLPVGLVQFWDIGIPGHGHQISLLASSIVPQDFSYGLLSDLAIPTLDGNSYYLVWELYRQVFLHLAPLDIPQCNFSAEDGHRLLVYLFTPFEPSPGMEFINELSLDSGFIYTANGTRIACLEGSGRITVWDFKSRMAASWRENITSGRDLPNWSVRPPPIYFSPTYILYAFSPRSIFKEMTCFLPGMESFISGEFQYYALKRNL